MLLEVTKRCLRVSINLSLLVFLTIAFEKGKKAAEHLAGL
jgi:hypothetical protein